MIELKPCPLCGSHVGLFDCTNKVYGFSGYKIECNCGLRFYSELPTETHIIGNTMSTRKTDNSKKLAFAKMVDDWNRRCENG